MCRLTFVLLLFFFFWASTRNKVHQSITMGTVILLVHFSIVRFCCFSNSFRHLQGKKKKKVSPNMAAFFYSLVHLLKKTNTKNSHSYSTGTNTSPLGFDLIFGVNTNRKFFEWNVWVEHNERKQNKISDCRMCSIFILWNINFIVTCFSEL